MTPPSKVCTKCRQEKPRDAFYRNRARPDGLTVQCKACHAKGLKARNRAKRVEGEVNRYTIREVKAVSEKVMAKMARRLSNAPVKPLTCFDCGAEFSSIILNKRQGDKYFCHDCLHKRVAQVLQERLSGDGPCIKDT